ncbi:MAG: glycosyltransferase family 9 protein [Xanthomonadales bacterium]|nr:glycosyltransferase family 9 protein [Xanthomonadales bacterium]
MGFDIQAWRRRIVSFVMQGVSRGNGRRAEFSGSIPHTGIYRILICRPNHRLGNLLMLTPLLAELQAAYPGAQVDLIVGGDQGAALFGRFPNVGTVYHLPRHGFRQLWKTLAVVRRVFHEHYDLTIDPDLQSQSSRYLVGRCRSLHRIGFCGVKSSSRLSLAMPAPPLPQHMGQLPVALLRWAMGDFSCSATSNVPMLDLRLSHDERAWGRNRLAELLHLDGHHASTETIAVFTHATGAKRYPDAWWKQLLAGLRQRYPGRRFVEILPAHGQSGVAAGIPGYYSDSPRRVAALLAATRLFVTADCGVMHLACAARGPQVIGLFQCSDPVLYGPYGERHSAISTAALSANSVCELILKKYPG